jgi:hypothetical protein
MQGKLMSEKYAKSAAEYDAAMTFEEIGERLGIRKQAAYFLFVSALKKLRKSSSGAKQLRELLLAAKAARRSQAYRTVGANSEVA